MFVMRCQNIFGEVQCSLEYHYKDFHKNGHKNGHVVWDNDKDPKDNSWFYYEINPL